MNAQRARVIRSYFKVREAFPPDDPLSVPLLRLMAAVNDVRYVQKAVLIGILRFDELVSDAERAVHEGENVYLLRLLAGHLHEAGIAFRALDDQHASAVNALISGDADAQAAIAKLRAIYRDASPTGVTKGLLEGVRTPWAFHYKHERFKEALEKHPEEAMIIFSEHEGLGRYTVTDDFARQYIVDKVGGEAGFKQSFEDAINLAGTLSLAVSHLLMPIFAEREERMDLQRVDEEIQLPHGITRELLRHGEPQDGAR
jgi:hypothetical protein